MKFIITGISTFVLIYTAIYYSFLDQSSYPGQNSEMIATSYRSERDVLPNENALFIEQAPTGEALQNENPPKEEITLEPIRVVFSPLYRTTLSCEVNVTTVKSINKRMGADFVKGDILIELDDTIFQGFRKKALGNLEKAKAAVITKKELFKDNIASALEVVSAEADLAAAESDVISADYAIKTCTIHAPYDGKVVNVFVEEFELIQQGKPLIEIVDDLTLIGKMLIPSSLLKDLSVGKKLQIKMNDTSEIVEGNIWRIDAVIDPASSLIKVDIEINNKERKWRAGMIGTTQINM